MKKEKAIIIVVQAAPKTQPGGVQGAFAKDWYQSEGTPCPVKSPPIPSAAKLSTKKISNRVNMIHSCKFE